MRGFSTLAVLAALVLAGCGGGSSEADQPAAAAGYRFVQVASGLESPVHVTAPRNQRGPRLRRRAGRAASGSSRTAGSPARCSTSARRSMCCGEQGLLSVAFHPRFARNGKYYVNYTDRRWRLAGRRVSRPPSTPAADVLGRPILQPQRRAERVRARRPPLRRHRATPARAAIPRTARRTSARRSASCSRSTSTGGERGGRSSVTACGTRGGSRSTARPATSTSATSARTPGRRSTSRPGGAPASRTTAGTSTRAVRASRTSR